jgi:hypothetical protein
LQFDPQFQSTQPSRLRGGVFYLGTATEKIDFNPLPSTKGGEAAEFIKEVFREQVSIRPVKGIIYRASMRDIFAFQSAGENAAGS